MKKILSVLVVTTLLSLCSGCGTKNDSEKYFGEEYFVVITEWGYAPCSYQIVYAKDTKVKYFIYREGYTSGMSPLYNADGTLQIYSEE